jgi:cystathionine gamma-synthase
MITLVNAPNSRIAHVGDVPLEHGGTLTDVRVAYESHGDDALPTLLVLGGISSGRQLLPSTDQPGWWNGVAGRGLALDPERFRIVSADYVGGRGLSSNPQPGTTWPVLSTRDQADALLALLDTLGIERLHAVVGASYGGMVALALAARQPRRTDRVIAVCAAHRSAAMTTALRSVQRRIVRFGMERGATQPAVAIARALAMTTYRTAVEFEQRFTGAPRVSGHAVHFPLDAYLDHHGRGYADSFPGEAFMVLSQSLDVHRVDPAAVTVATTLIAFDSDTLVPVQDTRLLASLLPDCRGLHVLPSRFGHDGFLREPAVNDIVAAALAAERDASGSPSAIAPEPARSGYAARAVAPAGAGAATIAVRAGIETDTQHGAVIPPVHLSTTYSFDGIGGKRQYDYSRSGNPTRDLLAGAIADLEHGAAGIVTATGMAAIHVVLQLLRPGDLLIASHDCYGGTYRLIQALARRQAFAVEFVDLTAPGAAAIIRALRPRMVWVETPSNPLLRITDIAAVTAAARACGALGVVDNTFLSPALQTPIAHGADIVVHSTTKYLNGHSDVVGGAIVAADVALAEELGWWANCTGATGSAFDSYLTLRGLRTLHPRIRAHEENARAVVDVLASHAAVAAVHYPGLPSHIGHATAARQQSGFGAMVSFELGGGADAARRVTAALRHFSLAESLGGVESLVAHPVTMTHAAMDAAARIAAGINDSLLRLSVGIEDGADLIGDLRAALDRA